MWEAYGLGNEDILWAGTAFQAGIAGEQQAPCGAVSAAAMVLGLKSRCSPDDKDKVRQAQQAANDDAAEVVKSFRKELGDITCLALMGVDLSDEAVMKQAIESGLFKKCDNHVRFVVEKLYELEEKRSSA